MPEQHRRVGHKPLLAVAGVAEGGVGQQPVQHPGYPALVFSGKAYGYIISVYQLEIHRTTAAKLQAEGQALGKHGINPNDMTGVVFEQVHQAGSFWPLFAQKGKGEPDAQHRTDEPEQGKNDMAPKRKIRKDQAEGQQEQRGGYLEAPLPPDGPSQ